MRAVLTVLWWTRALSQCGQDGQGSCRAHDQAAVGHGLLQKARSSKKTMDVKEHLFSEDDVFNDNAGAGQGLSGAVKDASESALESKVKIIHGIPVYGYHSALHADSEDDVELLATDAEPANWVIAWNKATDAELDNFCKGLPGKASCTMKGHPDEAGLPMDTLRATKSELEKVLAVHPEIAFAEADSKVYLIPDASQDETELLESEKSVPPWGLDRIDERNRDSKTSYTPSPKSGSGVHVYVLDTGVRTTHSQFGGRAIPTLESYNSVRKVCSPKDTKCAADVHGHGTHCAGTVAGKDYGVAPNDTIHAVAVLSPRGSGSTSGIVFAID